MVPATLTHTKTAPSDGFGVGPSASQTAACALSSIPLRGRRLSAHAGELGDASGLEMPCFVAGPENRFVAATLNRLLTHVGDTGPTVGGIVGPLLLTGPSGCGKTQLAHGLATKWLAASGDNRAAYLTAPDFTRQVATALADRSIAEFRTQLRRCRLLVIDDVHRLAGRDYAIEEFVHTCDALRDSGGLLVATTSASLADTPRLGRGLVSRMLSGVTLKIDPLSQVSRRELLRLALAALSCTASDDALNTLAEQAPSDPRGLFALAMKLRQRVRAGAVIGRPLALELMADVGATPSLAPADIIATVSKYYGLPKSKLTSSSRQQSTVLARAVAIYLLRELTPLSYDNIGRLLGGRDHTTVMHNFRRIDRALPDDRPLRLALDELRCSIRAQPTA